jgi:hypothetical protein
MNTRAILAAMGVAAMILVVAGAYLALFRDDGPNCSLPGCVSVDENCSTYRIQKQRSANIKDPFVKGVVDIGIVEGTTARQAAALLKAIDTATYLPIAPYRQAAFVCVRGGFEQEWVDRMRAYEWVEWAHVEGVTPIDTLGN